MKNKSYKIIQFQILLLLFFSILFLPASFASTSENSDHKEVESSHKQEKDKEDDSEHKDEGECIKSNNEKKDDEKEKEHESEDHTDNSSNSDDGEHDKDDKHDQESKEGDCGSQFIKPLGSAKIIIDNTAAASNFAIMTNMATTTTTTCSKSDVLTLNRCNSFSLGNNNIQVIQNDANGSLSKMIGVNNQNSSSYENMGKDTQLNYFTPDEHLIEIESIRDAAKNISALSPSLPDGTYGNISFEQFINNVALGRSMYGIVRVEIPLVKNTDIPLQNSVNKDGKSGKRSKYKLCGEKPTAQCSLCGPGDGTNVIAGESVCGINLGSNAQVNVFGTLMFDWIDCDSKAIITLSDLSTGEGDIAFNISVPVNINPVNQNATHTHMNSIKDIAQIVGANACPSGLSCNLPLNNEIAFNLVSENYKDKTGKALTNEAFNSLSQANKFNLLMPSGYAAGWATAFSALNISAESWSAWGFRIPNNVSGVLTENDIRKNAFQDMPAFLYSGGIVGLHHHTNISGLVYIPQAFDLEQNGIVVDNKEFVPSLQYINGAIIVRDGFYLEAKYQGGATIISNNPSSYDGIKLDSSSGRSGKFERFPATSPSNNDPSETKAGNDSGNTSDFDNNGNTGNNNTKIGKDDARLNPGAQWMEIRPQ